MGRKVKVSEQVAPDGKKLNHQEDGLRLAMQVNLELESVANCGVEEARRILRNDPNHVPALETLAKTQWKSTQLDELLVTLKKLIALNPYEPGYHSLLAGAYQSLGMCGEAVKSYLRAVDLGQPESTEMQALIEELKAWQGSLVADLLRDDPVFRVAYQQNPMRACTDRGFDFAVVSESTEHMIQDRQSRAQAFARPS